MREFSVPATNEVGPDEALTDMLVERELQRLRAARASREREPVAWREATGLIHSQLWLTAEEARERTKSTTRRFVRRQRSWFRRDAGLAWFDAGRSDLVDAVTAEITARTIGP